MAALPRSLRTEKPHYPPFFSGSKQGDWHVGDDRQVYNEQIDERMNDEGELRWQALAGRGGEGESQQNSTYGKACV